MKRWMWAAVSWCILAACVSAWLVSRNSSYALVGVSDMKRLEDGYCLIDNDGSTFNFYRIDRGGRILGKIDVPNLQGSLWHTYDHLTVDREGRAYVLGRAVDLEENTAEQVVYRCDFEREELEPLWRLPVGIAENQIQIQVYRETLYYAREAEGGTWFCAMDLEGKETVISRTSTPYSYLVQAFYSPSFGMMWVDCHGDLYRDGRQINGDGSHDYVHLVMDERRMVYTDMAGGRVESVGYGDGKIRPIVETGRIRPGVEGLDCLDVLPYEYGEDGGWVGALDLPGSKRVASVFGPDGEVREVYGRLYSRDSWKLESWLRHFGVLLLASAAIALLGRQCLIWSGGLIPVTGKLLAILIPVVMAGSLILRWEITKGFTESVKKMEYDLLYEIACQKMGQLDPRVLREMDLFKIPEDEGYRLLFDETDALSADGVLHDMEEGKGAAVASDSYFWVYLLRDGGLRYARMENFYYLYGTRVACYQNRRQMAQMQEAMDKNWVVMTEYNDLNGNWLALYIPILDEHGKAMGLVECGLGQGMVTWQILGQVVRMQQMMLALMLSICALIALVLWASLHPLSRLKTAVAHMGDGRLGEKVAVRGRDEIAEISRAFNGMSERIQGQMEYIEACAAVYEKFVPGRLLQIMGREAIIQVELGDHKKIQALVMEMGSPDFLPITRHMNGEAIYCLINDVLGYALPAVTCRGGVVDQIRKDGFTAFYTGRLEGEEGGCGHFEDALLSAITICEKWNGFSACAQGRPTPIYRISMVSGDIRVGVVGEADRMAASCISELFPLSEALQRMAEEYDARILLTGTVAREIPGLEERYRSRMIGYLMLEKEQRVEPVYEVFDGEVLEMRKKKEETREAFGQALRSYLEFDFYSARQQFAQILRTHGKDRAAREYVLRCDRYYQCGDASQVDLYLKHY